MNDLRYRHGPLMASHDDNTTRPTVTHGPGSAGAESKPAPRTPGSDLDLADRRRLSGLVAKVTGRAVASERLGRFEVKRLLGEGAFGEVYLGFDPDLRRSLALKLLKRDATDDALSRLRKEAQAMAALEHAGILTVYEIGSVADRAFIAMELAENGTLDAWARKEPRSFEALAQQIVRAARALAAAHDAGFVHRDVKPSNILVGADGRAKVSDFGLVHVLPGGDPTADSSTGKTTLAGTPAYMAPEQFDGADPTAAADQYALGVTLFELVFARRPTKLPPAVFDVEVPWQRSVSKGAPQKRVPSWLRSVMVQSLRFDPAQRFASLGDFADALSHGMGRRKRQTRGALVVGALSVAAGIGWWMRPPVDAQLPCHDRAQAALSQTWSAERAVAMAEALASPDIPYAKALADATRSRVDARASDWTSAWTRTCEAKPSAARDEEERCLDTQREQLSALLSQRVTSETLDPLAGAMGDVLDPSACVQSGTQPRVAAVGIDEADPRLRLLRQAELALARGELVPARDTALESLAELRDQGVPRLVTRAAMVAAFASLEQDLPEEAEETAHQALNAALSAGLDVQASEAALVLAQAVAKRTEPAEAQRWAALAVTLGARSGRSAAARAEALSVQARAQGRAGDIPGAAVRCEEAMELAGAAGEPVTPEAGILCAKSWVAAGRFDDAEPLLDAALAELRARFGPRHPRVASTLLTLAGIYDQASKPAAARAAADDALQILRDAYGSDDPRILVALATASGMSNRALDYDRALALALEAAAVARASFEPGHRRYNYAVCMALGFSIGFDCGDEARALGEACVQGLKVTERTPVEALSSPEASATAQGWIFATQAFQCFEDEATTQVALAGLERYADADNVTFELRTMSAAMLANADLEAGRFVASEARMVALLQRTRDRVVMKLREGMWRTTLARALAGQGKTQDAREEATRALTLLGAGAIDEGAAYERTWLREFLGTPESAGEP